MWVQAHVRVGIFLRGGRLVDAGRLVAAFQEHVLLCLVLHFRNILLKNLLITLIQDRYLLFSVQG